MDKLLVTERLYLRHLTSADAFRIYAYRNHPKCSLYQHGQARTLKEIETFIRTFQKSEFMSLEREQHYAICSQDQTLVGEIAYFYTEADQCITLGITIAEDCHRQGYAYEILKAIIASIQLQYPHLDIVALIDKDNQPSIRLFEKLGFYQEAYAQSRHSYIYVIDGNKAPV